MGTDGKLPNHMKHCTQPASSARIVLSFLQGEFNFWLELRPFSSVVLSSERIILSFDFEKTCCATIIHAQVGSSSPLL